MIKRVIQRYSVDDQTGSARDLKYWLTRSTSERIAAVDFLRRQHFGNSERLQRFAQVIEQK